MCSKCFRCGSKLYIDNTEQERVVRCSLCTAINKETGHLTITISGSTKISPIFRNSFYLYRWYHARHSTEWYYSNRDQYTQICVDLLFDHYYHVKFRRNWDEEWFFVSPKWKTLKTAKKWALVYGLDNVWLDNFWASHNE